MDLKVLEILSQRCGRVSEKSIELLAKSLKLEVFQESTDDKTRLSLGGRVFVIDVDISSASGVSGIELSLANKLSEKQEYKTRIENALLDSAKQPSLDIFASNLKELVRVDGFTTQQTDSFISLEDISSTLQDLCRDSKHGLSFTGYSLVIRPCLEYLNDTRNSISYKIIWDIDQVPKGPENTPHGIRQCDAWIQQEAADLANVKWNYPPYNNYWESESTCASFVLRLDPPVTVRPDLLKAFYYEKLPLNGVWQQLSTRTLLISQRLLTCPDGKEKSPYEYHLSILEPKRIECVSSIQIDHPEQMTWIIQVLRQAVQLETLISSTMIPLPQDSNSSSFNNNNNNNNNEIQDEESLEAFLRDDTPQGESTLTRVSFSISMDDRPRIQIITKSAACDIWIGLDGDIQVTDSNSQTPNEKLTKVLRVCQDLAVFVHYIENQK